MTKHDCAVIMAFTGVSMLKGNDLDIFYKYVAKILCRPVYTHEMSMLSEEIKEAARNDFVQLCRNASDVKYGKWEHGKCTNCEKSLEDLFEGDFYYDSEDLHFCPNCGARMDGKERD